MIQLGLNKIVKFRNIMRKMFSKLADAAAVTLAAATLVLTLSTLVWMSRTGTPIPNLEILYKGGQQILNGKY
jgi:hypothetical protein